MDQIEHGERVDLFQVEYRGRACWRNAGTRVGQQFIQARPPARDLDLKCA
ncbi:hypothetical protein [Catellatospora citrea]|uniref:Uncharacterized protein n=1 Tax=Catellatospora citrea TaxID=53366 RepID=A0A8J3KRW3_9ACTN|nr:hypothetical protein [Catellatospora citrea]GIG00865.1 hypothetical protein Cci01nite_59580 [Catellatospora citrea]